MVFLGPPLVGVRDLEEHDRVNLDTDVHRHLLCQETYI